MKLNTNVLFILLFSVCVLLLQPIIVSAKSTVMSAENESKTQSHRYSHTFKETAVCLNKVMHGKINWGNGTTWKYQNAMNLCRNSQNAAITVNCFENEIKLNEVKWPQAINICRAH